MSQTMVLELSGACSTVIRLNIDATHLPFSFVPSYTSGDYNEQLFESGKFADVTIKTMDVKEIKAHSWMLSRSKVFDAMLNKHDTKESREKIINIQDVEHDVMMEFLRFIYCDKIPKFEEMVKELLALGDRYEIPGLVNACGFHLLEKENIESITDILIIADNMKIERLKQAAIHFAIANRSKEEFNESWKKLKEMNPKIALEIADELIVD